MTNERAVEILNLDLDILGQYGGESAEAYKMAIQALEQQPTEMRDATEEERKSVKDYVESISKPTGVRFEAQPCEDAVSRKRVIILIDEASEIHPYKVVGDSNTYSNYNQGWTDACDWLYANIDGIPSVKSQASEEDIHREREQAYMLGYEDASKKFRTEPCEDCISRQAVLDTIGNVPDHNDGMVFEALSHAQRDVALLPSVTPRINLAETSQDCISRQKALDCFEQTNTRQGAKYAIEKLPSVKPQYTDEEIDKAQAVEQAYVDKMVELAVEEAKERYSDAIGKMKKAIDEMTEIHSDGEFYIKNVDAKWIISKYLCGAELKEANDG